MIKRLLIVLIILLIAVLLFGCKNAKHFAISGVVTDWEGNGVEGVHVNVTLNKSSTVSNETVLTTITDSSGAWSAIVAEGGVLVEVAKSEWAFTKMESNRYVSTDIMDINFVGTLEGTIYFKDVNLETVVRETINKHSDDILVSDVIGLDRFIARDKNIAYLDGLEYFLGANFVDLGKNQISDVYPLLKLKTNLRTLWIDRNDVNNPDLLEVLNLYWLIFDNNKNSGIGFLEDLTSLVILSIESTGITNIDVLGNLINLISLNISSNPITDIEILANLKNLKTLKLNGTQVNDISILENLFHLETLHLESTLIDDIKVLLTLTNLKEVILKDIPTLDISEGTDTWNIIMELKNRGVDVKY